MKRMLLLMVLVAVIATLSAQSMTPGISAGFGWAWFAGDDAEDAELESKMSFMFGVDFEIIQPGSPLVYEMGARFRTAGAMYEYEESNTVYDATYTYTYNLNYIDVLGKVKYELPLGDGGLYFRPFAGLLAGILLSAEAEVEYEIDYASSYLDDEEDSDTTDFKKNCNTLNWGLLLGGELLFAEKFTAGIEYNMGFTDLFKKSRMPDYTNSGFMLKVGMQF